MRNERKGEFSHPAIYAKKEGILTLRGRQLSWTSTTDPSNLLLNLDTMIEKKRNYNQKKDTEMLMVCTKDLPNGHIFSFSGGIT